MEIGGSVGLHPDATSSERFRRWNQIAVGVR